jgi:hypothetical protein
VVARSVRSPWSTWSRRIQLRNTSGWYLFHFAVTKPLAMYAQVPLARLFGRPDDADDHHC